MRKFICPITNKNLVWLSIDEYVVVDDGITAKTILGSCVSIILYDDKKNIFSINHFLNVDSGYPLTEKMILEMQKRGCSSIKAFVVGGANKSTTTYKVGKMNIDFAKAFLSNYNIPIMKEDTGGERGRTVMAEMTNNNIELTVKQHNETMDKTVNSNNEPKLSLDESQKAYNTLLKLSKKNQVNE